MSKNIIFVETNMLGKLKKTGSKAPRLLFFISEYRLEYNFASRAFFSCQF
jgi:hypothetical protein